MSFKKNYSINFRSLLSRLVIGIAASVVITGIATGLLHLEFWNYWWTLGVGGALGAVLLYKILHPIDWRIFLIGTALVALPAAGFQYALFYTQDEATEVGSLADYDPTTNLSRFLEINDWYYSMGNRGIVTIATEYRRRGRITHSKNQTYFAIPMYTSEEDTLPKVWMALDMESQKADYLLRLKDDEKLIRFDEICCFERLSPSLVDDFRSAIDQCRDTDHKALRDEAIFLAPLYEPFIPRKQWIRYSFYGFLGAAGGMAILALVVPARKDDDEQEEEEEEEDDDE
ncbi:MAG: hypothetical protein K2G93_05395 [Rikenella sp.]|nr:hypothetical protein [Rikenella sp.]